MASLSFELLKTDGAARLGRLTTPHSTFQTPMFMPVGTQATVKGLTPRMVEECGASILLGNTYHLALRPGPEIIAELGGLHRFMDWSGSILTDSGGYQIFSLAEQRKITDAGAVFRSHLDGALLELSPERAVAIQEMLGSDIAMVLDECPPGLAAPEVIREAMRRSILWARRCRDAQRRADQAQFAIVQGGLNVAWRIECAEELIRLDFPGYALGGFSVGEPTPEMLRVLGEVAQVLPVQKPRYLMGVGKPEDMLCGIARGIDLFDCVLPTRNGRNAQALTWAGPLRLRNAIHKRSERPLDEDCSCYTCQRFTRAYLNHLFHAEEMLGPTLISLHNVHFYLDLMKQARLAILENRFNSFLSQNLVRWQQSTYNLHSDKESS
ncbi:MAG TPA: tRNA guanosine(34) transglycosylase Tgt [Gemmatales bacterium]|nr:tRNA guanosine(34) transglycosylase Tgt [Gemmatales bacterium]